MDEQSKDCSAPKRNRDQYEESNSKGVVGKGVVPSVTISQQQYSTLPKPPPSLSVSQDNTNKHEVIEILSSDDEEEERAEETSNQENSDAVERLSNSLIGQDQVKGTIEGESGKRTFQNYFSYHNSAYVQNLAEICHDTLHDG